MNDVDPELITEAAEKTRVAFMSSQALACAAERTLTAIAHVRSDGNTGEGDLVGDLRTAAGLLAAAAKRAEDAAREAMEGADRLLDALGADARARVVAPDSR